MLDDSRLRRNQGYSCSRMRPLDDILHQRVSPSEIRAVINPYELGELALNAGDLFAVRNGQLNKLRQVVLASRIARSKTFNCRSQPGNVDRHHAAVDFGWPAAVLFRIVLALNNSLNSSSSVPLNTTVPGGILRETGKQADHGGAGMKRCPELRNSLFGKQGVICKQHDRSIGVSDQRNCTAQRITSTECFMLNDNAEMITQGMLKVRD